MAICERCGAYTKRKGICRICGGVIEAKDDDQAEELGLKKKKN